MLQNNLDQPFTENDIKAAIKFLKSKKHHAGPDRIRSQMLKCGIRILALSLTKFFNLLLKTRHCPDAWSSGLISPIFKSGDKSNPSNYRGVCVTSCLGKLFCSL